MLFRNTIDLPTFISLKMPSIEGALDEVRPEHIAKCGKFVFEIIKSYVFFFNFNNFFVKC